MKYRKLDAEIERRGIMRSAIANEIGTKTQTLRNKICGRTDFTWEEVNKIQLRFFPDMTLQELFEANDKPA